MQAFFATLLAVFTAIFGFFSADGSLKELIEKGDISGYADSVSDYGELPDFKADANGDFTVLQFSDTHFTTGLSYSDIKVLNTMKAQVQEYSPDLVVISGDMLDGGEARAYNKAYVLRTVGEMFDEMEQYWAYIPGNNDGLNYGTASDITAYLSQYEYCIAADEKDISGGAQYSVDIYNNEGTELTHSFVFLDTMDYDQEDGEHIYGYVHQDQVDWCEAEIAGKLNENPDVNISVFIHENTPAFAEAALYGTAYKEGYAEIAEIAEQYNIPKNAPLDEVFENAGCVGLVSMGHSHPSENYCSFYEGTYYHVTAQAKVMSTFITVHTGAENTAEMYDFETVKA